MFFVNLLNLYGNLPTGVVRCGTSAAGLPIGVQVVGPSYREDIVLAVMELLEKQLGGWKPPPEKNLAE
jgi:amidase